ncbi:Protein BASIC PENTACYSTEINE7 [Bienertia sinuspersici]
MVSTWKLSCCNKKWIQSVPRNSKQPEAGFSAVPIRCMPINEAANNVVDPEDAELSKPNKKPKNSKKMSMSNDAASKKPKLKVKKGQSSKAKGASRSAKRERKNLNFRSCDSSMDASGMPAPICSCTGIARQCYRPGARTAGRKMSHGAYDKLIQRLAAEGFDLTLPIDLKDHWAKHGTNKFVTIK